MRDEGIDPQTTASLLFCAGFAALGVLAIVLCLVGGAWFAGLVMLALTVRMAYGVIEAARPHEHVAPWRLERARRQTLG